MSLPDILPIRTSDRVLFELVPNGEAHHWKARKKIGDRLAAMVSPLNYIQLREVRAVEDDTGRADKALELARVEVFYQGQSCGGLEAIPELHYYTLAGQIVALSSVGADPFVDPPAESPR